ncbi:MAG: hypothetical protein JWN04_4582 [Myxococcaceae bacterium]|nr:hypothetical protein [Myxococcaceae bacterium]
MNRHLKQLARRFALPAWSLLACSSGCADPIYLEQADGGGAGRSDASLHGADATSDASLRSAAQPDGEPRDASLPLAVDGGQPAWAAGMLGQYAVRTRFFGRGLGLGSAFNQLTSEWVWLSTVSFDATRGQVRMSSRICSSRGINSFGGFAVGVELLYPQVLPPHEYQILSTGKEWWTDGDPALYGFSSASLVPCSTPGAHVTCASAQESWMPDHKCVCPSASDARPTSEFDCRIVDDDLDNRPGFTVRATGDVKQNYYARAVDDSDFVHGTMDALTGALQKASYAQNIDTLQVGCNPEPCARSDSTSCDPSLDPVLLKRLAGPDEATVFSCDDVLQQQSTLFPTDALVFPPEEC